MNSCNSVIVASPASAPVTAPGLSLFWSSPAPERAFTASHKEPPGAVPPEARGVVEVLGAQGPE